MKGVSPLIATILLIAFTIGVAGIISAWLTTFTITSTELVGGQLINQLVCSYGGISLSNLAFSSDRLTGEVENTRTIALGNITLQVSYTNSSSQTNKFYLDLSPREKYFFNVSASSNYDKIWVITNCSSVSDVVESDEVSS